MDALYYTIFLIVFPIMIVMSYTIIACVWLFTNRKQEAKQVLASGGFGGVVGYILIFIYFYLTRDADFWALVDLSFVGFLAGAGYSMLLFSLLPKNIRTYIKKRVGGSDLTP